MVIVFDVNGTLLNTEALAPEIRAIFGSKYTPREWFTETVLYAMATSLAGDYREFGDVAIAVLEMAAAARRVTPQPSAVEAVRRGIRRLPPFPEAPEALKALRDVGFRLAALSNSSQAALEEQLANANLTECFELALSVDSVRRFKPAAEIYRAAALRLGIDPHDLVMVAAHPWDLMGAARAGCRTAFVARPRQNLFPGAPTPEYLARDLGDLADQLLGRPSRQAQAPVGDNLPKTLPVAAALGAIALAGLVAWKIAGTRP
jgi:2-haloacid dehalogenase